MTDIEHTSGDTNEGDLVGVHQVGAAEIEVLGGESWALSRNLGGLALPPIISSAPEATQEAVLEYFYAQLTSDNTRRAYARAIESFLDFCELKCGVERLEEIRPLMVAGFLEVLKKRGWRSRASVQRSLQRCREPKPIKPLSAPSAKQHLAAVRMLFDWLVRNHILKSNPASSVRGPKHVVRRGKTPVLTAEEARQLLDAIETDTLIGLRDRAIIGTMVYSFARVGAVLSMKVKSFRQEGTRFVFNLEEKGGKCIKVPAHHSVAEYVSAWLEAAGIAEEKETPLFRSSPGRSPKITERPLAQADVFTMLRRRALKAGLSSSLCCHTFRATGITAYMANGGSLEIAQQIAGHESPRTTKLYDRTSEEINLDEIERIRI